MKFMQLVLCSCAFAVVLAGGAQAQFCPDNVIGNGDFTDGLGVTELPTGWSDITATPQYSSDGCTDPGSLQMWGNLVVGESVRHQMPGAGFEAGKQYRITLCYKHTGENPVLPQNVGVRLMAATTTPTVYPPLSGYDLIGVTPLTYSDEWISYTFPDWIAPHDATWITVNPENDSSVSHGDYVSWAKIDDICIIWLDPVSNESRSWGHIKGMYR